MRRYLEKQILQDLKRKMVFIGGPRQVGKTTLAQQLVPNKSAYLNWDIPEHREKILKREFPTTKRWIFDEIHKYRTWRNYLKGIYDLLKDEVEILVTGSARLDYYRFGGDSLQGRYHYLRLYPLSVAELKIESSKDLNDLLQFGGFPEPFLGKSQTQARRWSLDYRNRFIREDIMSLERVQDLGNLELLILSLPDSVGNPLSIHALSQNLQVSFKTVSQWIQILERLYSIFRIPPFGAPKIRAVRKEQKHYHLDWSLIKELPLRFENMVAVHLLKWVHYQIDTQGKDLELRYFRDVDGREVDFVLLENGAPVSFIECKWSDTEVSRPLRYLKARFPKCQAWQISFQGTKDYKTAEGIRVAPAIKFLCDLI